jgi:hypothetical protein
MNQQRPHQQDSARRHEACFSRLLRNLVDLVRCETPEGASRE